MVRPQTAHRPPAMNDCIDHCLRCHAVCLETINYCLTIGGQHASPHHIALLSTCADVCVTSADAMLRGADVHSVICGACAEVCRQCAIACEGMGEDAEIKRCAEFCRRCADSCAVVARH